MKYKKIIFAALSLMTLSFIANAQDVVIDYPKVGEMVKDHTFTDLEDYTQKSVKVSDFKGKWLILDFWAYSCGSCIASFPKMDELAKSFTKDLQIIMVGAATNIKHNTRNKAVMKERKRNNKYSFTVAYDSIAAKKYDVSTLPYILIINPKGELVVKTLSVTHDQILDLINGKRPAFSRQFSAHEKLQYDPKLPLLTSGSIANGGTDTSYLYRSILVPYSLKIPYITAVSFIGNAGIKRMNQTGIYEAARVSLQELYKLAYFGTSHIIATDNKYEVFSNEVILDMKDTSKFVFDKNRVDLKGYYAYSLKLPEGRRSPALMMKALQKDLELIFGYNVIIEKRPKIVYTLVVVDRQKANKLKTSGLAPKTSFTDESRAGYLILNGSIKNSLIPILSWSLPVGSMLLDRTVMLDNIDITLNMDIYSLSKVNKALGSFGLQIVKGQLVMDHIVIKD